MNFYSLKKSVNLVVMFLFCWLLTFFQASYVLAALPPEEEGICVRVRIRISQDVTMTRTAFRATLEINNAIEGRTLTNLSVTLDIRDSLDNDSLGVFGIKPPVLTGISAVDGTGNVDPGNSGKAVWTIVPTRDAAPDAPTQYFIGGSMSYTEEGNDITVPLFPAPITVRPDPQLVLKYFLVRDVYSDDPFTPEVEPSEPFPLGLIMTNNGKGAAHNVKIASSQPKIIENEKGLLIDFKIIGTIVNTDQISPSLTVNLGEIGPAQSAVARWMMTSSLQGKFIDYSAEFEHVDDLGDKRTSLIDSVEIHEIIHAVRVDLPSDDFKPDFLANDVDEPEHLPDTLHNSDGTTDVVNVGVNPQVTGAVSDANMQVALDVNVSNGWVYIRVEDPGMARYALKGVVRSDGRVLMVDENAWTTSRTIRYVGQAPFKQNYLHLFDKDSTGSYTLIYENNIDLDNDGVVDSADNCPGVYNPDQKNIDKQKENLAGYPPGDILGDACDPDDDNDGFSDTEEGTEGSDPSSAFSYPGVTTIHLNKGLNVVSLPAEVLFINDLKNWLPILVNSSNVEKVMAYDKAVGNYVTLVLGQPMPSFALTGGEGLLIYALQETDLTFHTTLCAALDLKPGMNFIGINCPPVDYNVYQLLDDLGSTNAVSVQRFDNLSGRFETAGFDSSTNQVGVDFLIKQGEGYLVHMRQGVLGFRP